MPNAPRQLPPSLRGPPSFMAAPAVPEANMSTHYSTFSRDRPRVKAPSTFIPLKDDIRIWIMEVEDYFVAEGIANSQMQAIYARNYVASHIKKRIMISRFSNDSVEAVKFNDWILLKDWLFVEYGPRGSFMEADLKMAKCKMFDNQSV
ncbi:hypothetical protein EG329_008335 [Mollisiaceae sp. DMI_Dod_QoI]|nr:hypothetical protein EG329_008335 [Helotiales sp. DMI_Dod_QoI]